MAAPGSPPCARAQVARAGAEAGGSPRTTAKRGRVLEQLPGSGTTEARDSGAPSCWERGLRAPQPATARGQLPLKARAAAQPAFPGPLRGQVLLPRRTCALPPGGEISKCLLPLSLRLLPRGCLLVAGCWWPRGLVAPGVRRQEQLKTEVLAGGSLRRGIAHTAARDAPPLSLKEPCFLVRGRRPQGPASGLAHI